jgi:transcriptional regulator with XRE-family HTH domain
MDFKKEIQKRHMKQKYFAERVNLSEPELSMYLRGTRPMPENIKTKLEQEITSIPVPS